MPIEEKPLNSHNKALFYIKLSSKYNFKMSSHNDILIIEKQHYR